MKKINAIYLICLFLFLSPVFAGVDEDRVIKKFDKGFLEIKASGLKVLHLKGTAYERGYQRGMLQDDLSFVTSMNITESIAWLGKGDHEEGLKILQRSKKVMEPYIPYRFREEIKGMADALKKKGSSITYNDILLHLVGSDIGMMDLDSDLDRAPARDPLPELSRCSSFSAWGNATKDGTMIMPGNADYYDTAEELRGRAVAVIEPTDGGYAYTGALWDLFFTASGINEKGLGVHGQWYLVSSIIPGMFFFNSGPRSTGVVLFLLNSL